MTEREWDNVPLEVFCCWAHDNYEHLPDDTWVFKNPYCEKYGETETDRIRILDICKANKFNCCKAKLAIKNK